MTALFTEPVASPAPSQPYHLARKDYVDTACGLLVPLSAVGAASGVASLDSGGDVPVAQLPVNVANGIPQLDGSGVVPVSRLYAAGASTYGVITLAGDLGGTAAAPTVPGLANKQDTTGKGAASGYASLDAGAKVPVAQIPTPAAIGAAATVHTHAAGDIVSGTIAAARLPNVIAPPVTDTISSNAITPSASSSNNHFAAPSASTLTINAPTSPTAAQMLLIEVRPTVSCTITLAAAILLSGTLTATIGPVAANKSAHIGMRYSSTAAAWILLAVQIQA